MNIVLDTWEGSELQQTSGGVTRISRNGVAEGISFTEGDDQALFNARDGIMSALGGIKYPKQPDLSLTRIVLRGQSSGSAAFQLIYESFTSNQPSAYYIRYTSYAMQRTTNMIPGSRIPIRIGYEQTKAVANPGGNSGTHMVTTKIPDDFVTMTFNMPAAAIEISGLVYGQPNNSAGGKICYVNDATWPQNLTGIQSFPKGYWLMFKFETNQSKYSGNYTFAMQAVTRVIEDWSETGILRSSLTGKFANVDNSTVAAMNALSYNYGIIYPPSNDAQAQKNGLVRAGGNPMTSFNSLMGIG